MVSGLFPDMQPPTHFVRRDIGRSVSELVRLTHTLSQCEPNIGTPQVTSGDGGSVTHPYCQKVTFKSYIT